MMKNFVIIMLVIWTTSVGAQNQEIEKTVEAFFAAFHQRDTLKLQTVCNENMMLQSISESVKGNKLSNESVRKFYNSIATIPNDMIFKEKILSYSIQIDGSMAVAWTPYEFYLNGKISHKGVNVFTLFKEKDLWKIISIIDTRRK